MILNSDIIIRNIKLSILTDMELEESFLSIHKDLESIFKNLKPYQTKLENIIYYGLSKTDFYLRANRTHLWICEYKVVALFMKNYNIDLETIKGLIQFYFKELYGIHIDIGKIYRWRDSNFVEKANLLI